jgi:hypothetical protein
MVLVITPENASLGQSPGAQAPPATVRIQTGLGTFLVPKSYLSGAWPESRDPGLAVAFWMPSGLPLKKPYVEKVGRPPYDGTPPTKGEFVFVASYNPSSTLIDPIFQFENLTSASEEGLTDFQITQESGLLRLFSKYTSQSGLIPYFGAHYVPEQLNRDSVFIDCWNQESVPEHPVCSGTAQLDAVSARFNIEMPAAHVNQALSSIMMLFHLLAKWRDTPFTLNRNTYH